jgi:hypothetical protein
MNNIELVISLPIWLVATVIMITSIPLCFFVLDYKIKSSRLIYDYLITGLRWTLWLSIVIFVLLPSWGIWIYGMFTFLLKNLGLWTFLLMVPVLIFYNILIDNLKKIPFMKRFLNFLHL